VIEPTRADQYRPLEPDVAAVWSSFPRWDRVYFPSLIGLEVDEIRQDYCRMRLPYRPELEQPAGVVHGGAIATLIDTVVVPAVGSAYSRDWLYVTIAMNISYIGAVAREDAIAEGWVEHRGRSLVFCGAEVRASSGKLAATGSLTYKVSPPRTA